MKLLFVCKSNFGRSQMAEAIFNQLSKKYQAFSAGIEEGRVTGRQLKNFPEHENLFLCMDEMGIDLREKRSKLLTSEMVSQADKVVVMADKDSWPAYLRNSDKVISWQVDDPSGLSLAKFREVKDKIRDLVENLIKETEVPDSTFQV